jgi:hypothetical protein
MCVNLSLELRCEHWPPYNLGGGEHAEQCVVRGQLAQLLVLGAHDGVVWMGELRTGPRTQPLAQPSQVFETEQNIYAHPHLSCQPV